MPLLGHAYYATMGAGLAIALIVIGVTLPLLKRMTRPESARFEKPRVPYPADAGRPPPSRGLTNSILLAGSGQENPGKLGGASAKTGAYQFRPRSSASSRAAWVGVISACAPGWVRR